VIAAVVVGYCSMSDVSTDTMMDAERGITAWRIARGARRVLCWLRCGVQQDLLQMTGKLW
jgi:hypothetical protein